MNRITRAGKAGFISLFFLSFTANAESPFDLSAAYTADVVNVWAQKGSDLYYLDNIDLVADADLDKLVGWNGATAHVYVLNNLGGMPNDRAGTLQGINNIEVASQRIRLFEAWIEQKFGERTSVRAGLYDLNSEFYSNDSAGLLIAPAFGVGSEIAATGPNGPSIFPSTAIAIRIDHKIGAQGFVRAAVLNATASTVGDPQGVNLSFDDGALGIVETGVEGDHGKIAIGAWGYSKRQDDLFEVDEMGDPLRRRARGAYIVAERPLNDPEGLRGVTAFLRAGISDGKTTPFKGGWQTGLLITKIFDGRPDSQFSIGANQAFLSGEYRRLIEATGVETVNAETAFEITYSDKLAEQITVQPDFQLVLNPGGEDGADRVLVTGLRVTVEF